MLSHHRRGQLRSRPALLGVSDGIVAVSPVSASPDGAAPCSGWIATAVCDATAAPFGRVWSVDTEGSSCHTREVALTADWPRGRGAAAYLTPNLSALLALCDGGSVVLDWPRLRGRLCRARCVKSSARCRRPKCVQRNRYRGGACVDPVAGTGDPGRALLPMAFVAVAADHRRHDHRGHVGDCRVGALPRPAAESGFFWVVWG